MSAIIATHFLVSVKKETVRFVFFVNVNSFTYNLIMTTSQSFLKKIVPAYHLEQGQTPSFKAHNSMTIYPRLLVITFQLPTVDQMTQLVSKLQMILEKGHQDYQEMLAGHVPNQLRILKANEEPLLIMSNICSRPLKQDVISAMEALKIQPVKILTQQNAAKIVDLYMNNDHLPRFLHDVVLGQLHHRQRYHQTQMDLAAAQAEVAVTPSNQEWYMTMTDMKHLNKARFLKTKEQLDQEAGPAQPKRSNPYQVIQNIKKARVNKSTTGHTKSVPQQTTTTTEEDPFSDDQEFLQTLNDSEVQVEIPASSSPTIQEMNIPTVISSLVVLLEGVQGACADALRSFKQLQSK